LVRRDSSTSCVQASGTALGGNNVTELAVVEVEGGGVNRRVILVDEFDAPAVLVRGFVDRLNVLSWSDSGITELKISHRTERNITDFTINDRRDPHCIT